MINEAITLGFRFQFSVWWINFDFRKNLISSFCYHYLVPF